jgi:hypothetical protein
MMSADLLRAARDMSARLDHLRELAGDMRAAVERGAAADAPAYYVRGRRRVRGGYPSCR